MSNQSNSLCVIAGFAGSGKTTLVDILRDRELVEFNRVVTATTRKQRPGEVNGEHYHFLTPTEFGQKMNNDGFLEWAEVHGNLYGTPKSSVLDSLRTGKRVILVIDVHGFISVKRLKAKGEIVNPMIGIFIDVPSPRFETLQKRMVTRGDNPVDIVERIKTAQWEYSQVSLFDKVVVNGDLETAVKELAKYINSGIVRL